MPDKLIPKAEDSGPVIPGSGKTVGQSAEISEKDIVIHTMPKRFLNATAPERKAKSIGLLILISGGMILIFGSILAYLYLSGSGLPFLKKPGQAPIDNELSPSEEQPDNLAVNQTEKNEKEENSAEKITQNPAAQSDDAISAADSLALASSTEEKDMASTSAETDEATTTIKTIVGFNSGTSTVNLIYPADSDLDGLFDIEERIFGSSFSSQDSDGDGYEDLAEVLGLYDPAGNSKIIANKGITKYTNNQFNFSLYYPVIWKIEKAGGDDSIIFNIGNSQFIQAITVVKDNQQITLNDWYKTNTGNDFITSGQIIYKKGWEGIKNTDNLNIYLTKPNLNFIIVMSYSLGTGNEQDYKNIFTMMVNSLEINQ